MHPRNKQGTQFSIFDKVNSFSIWSCFNEKQEQIEDLCKEIGLGATLFLMCLRALSWLFFVISVIHIPVYMFYYQASDFVPVTI